MNHAFNQLKSKYSAKMNAENFPDLAQLNENTWHRPAYEYHLTSQYKHSDETFNKMEWDFVEDQWAHM